MKKLLTVAVAIMAMTVTSCSTTEKPKTNTPEAFEADLEFFTDPSCSELKNNVKNTRKFESQTLAAVADKMLADSYDPSYIIAQYEAYPSPQIIGETLKLGDGFSKYENMTGVYLEPGEHLVLVGETGGRNIKLLLPNLMRKPAEGVKPTEDPNGWNLHKKEFALNEGVNIIQVDTATNAYISYFEDNYEAAPRITVHFPTGKVNGYFDAATMGNAEWDQLLANAVSPIMDARGTHIQVAYPVEWFKEYTSGKGVELMAAYDKMLNAQYTLMGLVKYKKLPKNRVFARVNFNYYMFRDEDGVAYLGDKGTMRMVAQPDVVVSGDPCWGFSHEVGHVMQMRPITWGGMTEVSNNIFSLYTSAAMGNESRLKNQKNYDTARAAIIGKNISYLHDGNPFNRLVPFWQLNLYFTQNGFPDFYGDVMEQMRQLTNVPEGNESIKSQFKFIEICCDVTKTDLTDFFDKWGFFWVGKISLEDYAQYDFNITQSMVDDTKKYIASKGYAKPATDLTLVKE